MRNAKREHLLKDTGIGFQVSEFCIGVHPVRDIYKIT